MTRYHWIARASKSLAAEAARAGSWSIAILGAVLFGWLAGSTAASASERADATPASTAATSLPNVLKAEDAAHYREIFRLQVAGRWREADRHVAALKDRILLGHVLFQRYMHPTKYRSQYKELRDWMRHYRDHPNAYRIYRLAMKRRPPNWKAPPKPRYGAKQGGKMVGNATPMVRAKSRSQARIVRKVRRYVRRGRPDLAKKVLGYKQTRKTLTNSMYDTVRAEVAMGYFLKGKDNQAYRLAAAGAERSRATVSISHWIAGLAATRLGKNEQAAIHFEEHALSPAAAPSNISAGAYWAARMHLKNRNPQWVERWLRIAAEHPRTFYGILARRTLGLEDETDWSRPRLTRADIDVVLALPGGRRALALAQIDQHVLAERELALHLGTRNDKRIRALLAVADYATLPRTAVRLGYRLAQTTGSYHHRALYPIPPWAPRDGYQLDRALIFAFMRQESQFHARARSSAGARGLMQLMPRTASYMSPKYRFRGRTRDRLYEPELNLSLGQDFLQYLLKEEGVDGNLFKLAVAYNGGSGNLRKWQRQMNTGGDPLMFIESLPSRETRIFIERVLANLWMYRLRLGQPTPSLDDVASGEWPRYVKLDTPDVVIAEDVKN